MTFIREFKYPDGEVWDPYIEFTNPITKQPDREPDEGRMLAELLLDEVVFAHHCESKNGVQCMALSVMCNDQFYWACADCEPFTYSELPKIYDMYVANRKWGTAKWVSLKRGMRPQRPFIERMKKDGAWDEELEALPERTDA